VENVHLWAANVDETMLSMRHNKLGREEAVDASVQQHAVKVAHPKPKIAVREQLVYANQSHAAGVLHTGTTYAAALLARCCCLIQTASILQCVRNWQNNSKPQAQLTRLPM
jgi:hypothetical protein